MLIRKNVIQKIRESIPLRNRIALAVNRSEKTVSRWILDAENRTGDNGIMLTMYSSLEVIGKDLNLRMDEILESEYDANISHICDLIQSGRREEVSRFYIDACWMPIIKELKKRNIITDGSEELYTWMIDMRDSARETL